MALVNQPTAVPTRKVGAAALGGAIITIGVYVASLFNVEIPGDVAAASTTLAAFGLGYFVRDGA